MITAIQSEPTAAISEPITSFRCGAGGRGFRPTGHGPRWSRPNGKRPRVSRRFVSGCDARENAGRTAPRETRSIAAERAYASRRVGVENHPQRPGLDVEDVACNRQQRVVGPEDPTTQLPASLLDEKSRTKFGRP